MKNLIILNAKAYNKYLTDEYLDQLSNESILRFCNPIDRMDFVRTLQLNPESYKQKYISNQVITRR